VAAVLAVAAGSAGAEPPDAAPGASKRYAAGRILVGPRAGLADSEFRKALEKAKGRAGKRLGTLQVQVVEVPAGAEEEAVRTLRGNPHVKFAELDREVALESVVPNDPKYASAWHLAKIQAPGAWDTTLGAGVTVAVLDTGVDSAHLDLGANLVPGWNVVSNSADTSDVYGHGTLVAGTVAALSNNALGVTSIAWGAKVMPVRISNNSSTGSAYVSDMARGITWAADHGARVANISYDASGSPTIDSAAQYLRGKGGVVVTAAGNSSTNPGYAANPYLLAVSATTSTDAKASWSNYGNYVDFAAPGVGIWTTARGGTFSAASGTSFASPTAAAVAALVMAANPQLSPANVEAVLQASADDLGTAGWDELFGHGRVNAAKAVALAVGTTASDTMAPQASITAPSAGKTVSGLVAVDASASDNLAVTKVELYVNGVLKGTDTTAPYAFSWDSTTVANGSATLVARAYDSAGNQGTSPSVAVQVANGTGDTVAPTVTISNPADGATVSGAVSLAASATDNVGVAMVSLYVDGKLLCSSAPAVACTWNARKASAGTHTVSATAKDAAGNSGTASVKVTVGTSTATGKPPKNR
jgi:subtilisin family serine protease